MRKDAIRRFVLPLAGALALSASLATDAQAQWQISTQDGKSTLKLGFLAQPQGEWIDTPSSEHTSQNLFLRRIRLILGGNIDERWSFFIETDSTNLGKATGEADPRETKNRGDIFLQDVVLTWSRGDAFKVDTGMLQVPVSHNTQQGAGSLLPIDNGPYSYLHGDPTTSRAGRDYGLQLRGYPFDQRMEYRLGVFQGYRGENATEPLRVTGRLVWYPFEADTGFFYTGTTLGTKRILALGASYDRQGGYRAAAGDIFYDQPLPNGDGVTLQADFIRYDGGDFFPLVGGEPQLPRQNAWLLEGGYYLHAVKMSPFVQLALRDFEDPAAPDESKSQIGVAWWPRGHRLNLKLAVARLERDGEPDRTQVVAQCQILTY